MEEIKKEMSPQTATEVTLPAPITEEEKKKRAEAARKRKAEQAARRSKEQYFAFYDDIKYHGNEKW